jgi:hypothetical protein
MVIGIPTRLPAGAGNKGGRGRHSAAEHNLLGDGKST